MKTIRILLGLLILVAALSFIQKKALSKPDPPFVGMRKPPPGMYEPAGSRFKFLEKLAPSGDKLALGVAWKRHTSYFIKIEVPASSTSGLRFHRNVRLVLDDGSFLYAWLMYKTEIVSPGTFLLSPIDSFATTVPPGRSVISVDVLAVVDKPGKTFPTSSEESFPELSGPVVRDLQRKGAGIIVCPVGPQPNLTKYLHTVTAPPP